MFNRILLIFGIALILLGGAGLLYSLTRQFPHKTDSFEITDQLPQIKGLLRALPPSPTRVVNLDGHAELQPRSPKSVETLLNNQQTGAAFLHHSSKTRSVLVGEEKATLQARVGVETTISTQSAEPLLQSPSPAPTPGAGPKHRNPLSRFFRWFFGLFRERRPRPPLNAPPTVSLTASSTEIILPGPPGNSSEFCKPSASRTVDLTADASDENMLLYTWSVTGGTLSGDGRSVAWDLSGVNPGTYTATVTVNDANNHTVASSTTVTIAECPGGAPPCPQVSVSCQSDVAAGAPITVSSFAGDVNLTYNWSVSAGQITSGQGTSTITVDTTGLAGQTVTATVEVDGLAPSCSRTASCSTSIIGLIPTPSATPTPRTTPTPQSTPTPIDIGVKANSNTSNSPLPSPAQTPTSSPMPSPSSVTKEVDKIELNYPIELPVGWSENVTVHFVRTSETTFIPVIENKGRITVTDTPRPIPGANPGPYKQAWGPEYTTFATVELKALNLAVLPVSQPRQSLDPLNVEWEWQISGKKDFLGKQALHLSINVEGQKRDDANVKIVLDNPTVMVKDFSIEVAESWFTRTQATVSSAIGMAAGAGVTVPWIYERYKGRGKSKTKKKRKKR